MTSRLRTANLLAAFSGDVQARVNAVIKNHPNQTDSATAALNIIGTWDGIKNADLAKALQLSHTATVRLVDKLEAQGHVAASGGEDKRVTHLALTSVGRAALEPMLKARCIAVDDYLDVLTPEEEQLFTALLEKLMRPMAKGLLEVSHFCRLCDYSSCAAENCPMHENMHAWGEDT